METVYIRKQRRSKESQRLLDTYGDEISVVIHAPWRYTNHEGDVWRKDMAGNDIAKKDRVIEYVSLKNDLLFHMVFTRNGKALKGLLSALLNLPEPDILSVEVLNPMQYSDVIDSKLTVLDIKVHLDGDAFVLVEIQVRRFEHWTNRTLTYVCR